MYTRRNGHMSTRFEKLVKLSGTNLTQSVYPMITYVQVMNPYLQQFLNIEVPYFVSCFTLRSTQD